MQLKYDIEINDTTLVYQFKRLTNQIYKLLPSREENIDWEKPLDTIIEELAGMGELFVERQEIFFSLLCKLEGLFKLTAEEDFLLFRRIIFECLSLMNNLKQSCL